MRSCCITWRPYKRPPDLHLAQIFATTGSRFAGHCSDALYEQLEAAVMLSRDGWELKTVEEQLELLRERPRRCDPLIWEDGFPRNRFGERQQVLLEALPAERRSARTNHLVVCWRAKFGIPSPPVKSEGTSFSVESSIPVSYLMQIPDSQWLSIARGGWSGRKGSMYRPTGPETMSKRSHQTFAADFGVAAKRDPTRFSRLALQLEGPAVSLYVGAVLWAVGDPARPENAASTWAPAPPEVIEQLARHEDAIGQADSSIARAFCFAVRRRVSEAWPLSAIDLLARYAKHAADPEPNSMPVRSHGSGGEVTDNLETSALNCVRGAAVYALGALQLGEPTAIDAHRDALRSAADDPHPAVRIAVQAAARGLLKSEPSEALSIFLAACRYEDDRVLASSECRRFLVRAWRSHTLELTALIERMIISEVQAAAQLGAECATAAWLYDRRLESLFRRCEKGTAAHRLGVARVAAGACSEDEDPSVKAPAVLVNCLGDEEATVRQAATQVFSSQTFLTKLLAPAIAASYARSAAFLANPDALVDALAEDPSQIGRFQETIGILAARFGELSGPKVPWDLDSKLTTLILGLYESTEDAEIRRACLDAFDALLQASSPRIQRHLDSLGSA